MALGIATLANVDPALTGETELFCVLQNTTYAVGNPGSSEFFMPPPQWGGLDLGSDNSGWRVFVRVRLLPIGQGAWS